MKFFIRPMVLSHVASRKAFAVVCLSVVCCLLSVVCCLLSVVCCLLSVVCCLLSVVLSVCLLSVVCCSVVCCLLSVVCCLLSVFCCLLSLVSCQLSVVKVSPFPRVENRRSDCVTPLQWTGSASLPAVSMTGLSLY